jgi:hypothetical protein
MKKNIFIAIMLLSVYLMACRPTKQINKAIAPKETLPVPENQTKDDSLKQINDALTQLKAHYIDFRTFNAKIKVESSDSKGKNPDITAVVRIIKDSAIWMSLSATFLNIEVYRVLIKKDSVILLNKQEKEVQYRSMDYLQEVTQIPFDYQTVQDLIIGNPVFFNDKITSFRQQENYVLMTSVGDFFKNLLTLTHDSKLMLRSKMDDVDQTRSRTADVTYDGYENNSGIFFSTMRQITASEKNKIDIRLNYKQYEFNKDLSVSFSIPKNYKRK